MLKRLTFECWHCKRPYSLLLELAGKPKLSPECPYCGAVGIVELDPYRGDTVDTFKSDSSAESDLDVGFTFPDLVPTSPPPDGG